SYNKDNQFLTLLPILKDYGITRNLSAVISDNAGINDTLYRTIEKYIKEEEAIIWKSLYKRIRCNGHIINLTV
ncbi:uncharacterized protein K441DRAFT_545102, partial [Cenococcum geophilum 1.58]|uniref:uncharacterized protein n=1 Tax=Cenococcum geophilum 1.58 TaxID=794803 RepID=UPI00358FCCA8